MKIYPVSEIPDISSLQELADALSAALKTGIRILTPSGKQVLRNRRYGNFYRKVLSDCPAANAFYEQFISEFIPGMASECPCNTVNEYTREYRSDTGSTCCVRSCRETGLACALVSIVLDDSPIAIVMAEDILLAKEAVDDGRYRELARSLHIDEEVYLNGIHQLPPTTDEYLEHVLDLLSILSSTLFRLLQANLNLTSTVHCLEDQESLLEELAERDPMTGLYNRRKFEEMVSFYSSQKERQICMISADANFLKLTNDIFGHEAGDLLLQAIGGIMYYLAKGDWLVARCGGDEFRAILPDTSLETALDYCRRVARNCSQDKSLTLPLSVALGAAEWDSAVETLSDCFSRADVKMYQNKTALKHELRIPHYIMERLYDRQILDKTAVESTAELTQSFALYLGLSKEQAKTTSVAAQFQDIGMAKLPESFVIRGQSRTEEETAQFHMHVAHSYTMARQFDELYKIADIIHCTHENWDGSGYPNSLKEEDIPVEARIIRLATDYVLHTHPTVSGGFCSIEETRRKLAADRGRIYDPELTLRFLQFLDERPV